MKNCSKKTPTSQRKPPHLSKNVGIKRKQDKGSCEWNTLCFCCLKSISQLLKYFHGEVWTAAETEGECQSHIIFRAKGRDFRALKGWKFNQQWNCTAVLFSAMLKYLSDTKQWLTRSQWPYCDPLPLPEDADLAPTALHTSGWPHLEHSSHVKVPRALPRQQPL